jgi:hypothetical protein
MSFRGSCGKQHSAAATKIEEWSAVSIVVVEARPEPPSNVRSETGGAA